MNNVGGPSVLLGDLKGPQVVISRLAVQIFLTSPAAKILRCPDVGRPVLINHRQLGVTVDESGRRLHRSPGAWCAGVWVSNCDA